MYSGYTHFEIVVYCKFKENEKGQPENINKNKNKT